MSYLNTIILGVVQGLTEFLPVSSSGHLVLAQHLLGLTGPQLAFDIMLHLGTLLAVVIYFRRDIMEIVLSAASRSGKRDGRRWMLMIILATIPTGLIGFFFKDKFESLFGDPHLVAMMLLVTAALLFIADRLVIQRRNPSKLTVSSSLIVGIVQGIAIIPGISRSGSTIAAGIFTGLDARTAARFSFLVSIPAILGATFLELKDLAGITGADYLPYLTGTVVASVVGYLAIGFLMNVLMKRKLWTFGVYLLVIGVLGLILL
ncbi:MAG: undecaprenyl-diphosphatase UppP [bacterium]|nr:undecaprenyl-diphosphatase UppP [bacterium]